MAMVECGLTDIECRVVWAAYAHKSGMDKYTAAQYRKLAEAAHRIAGMMEALGGGGG